MRWFAVLKILAFLPLFLLLQSAVFAQADSAPEEKNLRILPVPLVFFLPETSLGFGGAASFTFDIGEQPDGARRSQVLLGGAYTLFNQILSYTNFQVFPKQQKIWLRGELGFYRYFYYYYGIGPNTTLAMQEDYNVDFPRVRLDAMYQVKPKLYAGLRYWLDDFNITKFEPGELISQRTVDRNGGTVSGIGGVFVLDTRDNIYAATNGYKIEGGFVGSAQFTSSSFDFFYYQLQASTYLQPWKKYNHVWGFDAMLDGILGHPPFFALPMLGSPRMMRGYYQGRFRDNIYAAFQTEYRMPLFWKLEGTAFASAGWVANSYETVRLNEVKTAAGAGLRLVIDEKDRVKVRLDVAYGESLNFYLTFNEAF